MAVKTSPTRKKAQGTPPIIVQQLQIRNVDRTPKDIATWRQALQAAESVHYPNPVRLYDLYADVMLDTHLSGIIQKRTDAVLNKTLTFKKGDKKVDELDALIDSMVFRKVLGKIMEVIFYGRSGLEFIPGPTFKFIEIPRKHIRMEKGVIVFEQYGDGATGVDYTAMPNLWVIGEAKDFGLLLKCSVPALFKKNNTADWAQYIEIFGQPFRVAQYAAHDKQTKEALQEALDQAGSGMSILIPQEAKFELKDGKQSNGDGNLQNSFRKAMNDEMSVAILTVTETTTSSDSSGYAQSQEHGQQGLEITASDLKHMVGYLNAPEFLAILESFGYPVAGGHFEYAKEVNLDKVGKQLDNALKLKKSGVPVADDYFYDTSGVPKPADYDAQKAASQSKSMPQDDDEPDGGDDDNDEPKPEKKRDNLNAPRLTPWQRFRLLVADFFDHPRKR